MEKRLILKYGNRGEDVKLLQSLLGMKNPDGIFGNNTKNYVVTFQRKNGLVGDGIVGPITWDALNWSPEEMHADTDTQTSATWIERYHLPEGEYVDRKTSKKYIFLHHTAGRHNPYLTVDDWANDQRGRVGTNYVIGGIPAEADPAHLSQVQGKYDGKIIQAIDDMYWGYHLGSVGSSFMIQHSLSIEICNAGALSKRGSRFYTWFGQEVHPSQVVTLPETFRGSRYYHKYTESQLNSVEALLHLLSERHDINLKDGMRRFKPEEMFEFNQSAWKGAITGILSHTNVRRDKSDVFPQPELVKMIMSF